MDRTACTEPQCLYKGALYLTFFNTIVSEHSHLFFYSCIRVKFTLRLNDQSGSHKSVHGYLLYLDCQARFLSDDVTFTNISVLQGLLENQS